MNEFWNERWAISPNDGWEINFNVLIEGVWYKVKDIDNDYPNILLIDITKLGSEDDEEDWTAKWLPEPDDCEIPL